MTRLPCLASSLAVALAMSHPAPAGQDVRALVCAALDRPPRELATIVESLGPPARAALLDMTAGPAADATCGLAGLAAVRDARVAPRLVAAIDAAPADANVWRLVRWAAFVAGGPDPASGAAFAPLLARLESPAARAAAGEDRLRLLGELDLDAARERLVASLDEPLPEGAVDAAIHALARQREPRARARVQAIGADMASGLAGNATYEQARRLSAAAFYLLTLDAATHQEGLALLARLSPQDQADTAAWTMQTLCELAVRRPAARADLAARRQAVSQALTAAGVRWDHLTRGAFPCVPAD